MFVDGWYAGNRPLEMHSPIAIFDSQTWPKQTIAKRQRHLKLAQKKFSWESRRREICCINSQLRFHFCFLCVSDLLPISIRPSLSFTIKHGLNKQLQRGSGIYNQLRKNSVGKAGIDKFAASFPAYIPCLFSTSF